MNIEQLYDVYIDSKGISTDTRSIKPGELYFALKGERFNGNSLAQEAIDKGALMAVVDDQSYFKGSKMVIVEDSLNAMQELAKYHRNQFQKPVLGITGSNGKTTTKELIVEVLRSQYTVHATKGNFNNHIGVPLTILAAPLDSDIWIIELGTNAPGEISFLCEISIPTLGLITNIGAAHLEKLINLEGVFIEKTALFESVLKSDGAIFLNTDDPYLSRYIDISNSTIKYDSQRCYNNRLVPLVVHDNPYLNLEVVINENRLPLMTQLMGNYNQINVAAALCIGAYFEVDIDKAVESVANYVPNNMRSQLVRTERNTVVLDGYNANPTSMKKAIESFMSQAGADKVLFIGDMLELGESSSQYHNDIVQLIESTDLEFYLIGQEFQKVRPQSSIAYETVQVLLNSLDLSNMANKEILLKGSRGVRLEKLMAYL